MRLEKRIAKQRERRRFRVRNKVRKTGRPRLSVFRSNKYVYAQVIDDLAGRTLVAASSRESEVAGDAGSGGNKESAARVGKLIAERALQNGISSVSFDRGQYRFHGRVAALAEAAREAGLQF